METFVGTSGWSYDWNLGGTLDWYVMNSGLNAVELNASFYRFPFDTYVRNWRDRGASFRWGVKVHRSITHIHRFNERALEIWGRFRERFQPLDELIDYYLFQAPPRYQDTDRLLAFFKNIDMKEKVALELRDSTQLGDDDLCARLQESLVVVSVDSPDFKKRIFHGDTIYLRMHGREDWYQHAYRRAELQEIAAEINRVKPERVYVFFNNNHDMLKNARLMVKVLGRSG
ncbi:MAG: DUF72 domain-containing protein [Methanomicrobiales archaeon]|nr:DUF72 domain-containing protein [Methanomicrobiales archaeon]